MVIIQKNNEDKIGSPLKPIQSYYEVKLKQRKEAELKKDNELKNLFIKALNFYTENYPNSFQKRAIIWSDKKREFEIDDSFLLFDTLKICTIEDLYQMAFIIKYSLDEHNFKKVPTRNQFNTLRGMIIKMIPGGRETMEIKALQTELNITNLKIKELELRKKERLVEFEVDLEEAQETIKPIEIPVEIPIINKAIGKKCPYCEGIKGNKAGMTSHVMHKHKDNYEDFKIEFKEQMWADNEAKPE